jgi:outer membrane protein
MVEEISKTAVGIAKQKGATILLDKSGPTLIGVSNILYSDAAYEITDEVAKEVNKDRPAAAATAPAAAPAAPKAAEPAADGARVTFPGATPKK